MTEKDRPGGGDAGPGVSDGQEVRPLTKQTNTGQDRDAALHKDRLRRDAALLALLCDKWPAAFALYQHRRRPLAIGIDKDILAALSGTVSSSALSRVLRSYTSNAVYRSHLFSGAARFDLNGEPAGEVTPDQVRAPTARAAPAAPADASPPPPAPKKLTSLADLREAARLRREAV
jgi:ProQ/FINO family